jgi:hypothetical protein
MKKLAIILLVCLLLCGCISYQDPVLSSLPSEGQGKMYTCGGFQDYTDYGKYQYDGITEEILQANPYFQIVTTEDIRKLAAYLENFEGWVALESDCEDCELAEMYDFSPAMFREGDYFCIVNECDSEDSIRKYSQYNIYYFSIKTQTLYYFHNNI